MLNKNPEAIPSLTSEKIEFRLKPSLEDAILPSLALKVHDTEDIRVVIEYFQQKKETTWWITWKSVHIADYVQLIVSEVTIN